MSYTSPSPLPTNETYNKKLNDNHHVEVTSSPKILQPSVTSAQHLMRTLSPSGTYIDKLKDVPHLEIFLSPKIRIPTNIQLSVATIKKSMPSSLTAIPTNAYSSVTHVEKIMASTQSSEPEFLPKITPTFHPASFVPNHCNLSKEERKNIIMKELRSVSKEIITGSFQDLAASWLIEEDSICPNERNIKNLK